MTRGRFSAWWAGRLRFEIEHAGGKATRLLSASDVIWIGRAPSCQLVLDAPEIARRHLSISTQHGKLFVRDHSGEAGHAAPPAIRRLTPPTAFQLGPYRIGVALVPPWPARAWLRGGVRAARARLAPSGGRGRLSLGGILVASVLVALGLVRAIVYAPVEPPVAAAACTVDRAALAPVAPVGEVSVLRAVQLLRAGRRAEALVQYRALSARDDSPAPLAVVAGLLEYELACPR